MKTNKITIINWTYGETTFVSVKFNLEIPLNRIWIMLYRSIYLYKYFCLNPLNF